MRRLRITAPGRAEIESVPSPSPSPGEAIVRVESCGLCGSDASMFTGKHPVITPPLVPGHEIVGSVVAEGGGAEGLLGRRVAVLPQIGCGECTACTAGHPRLCDRMRLIGGQIDGGAAEEVRVPTTSLVAIPDAVSSTVAPIVEPLAVAYHAVGRAGRLDGAHVLVVGGGPIGLLVALTARARGAADVTLIEPVPARQQVVSHFGVRVAAAIPSAPHDVVFDCVGGAVGPSLLATVVAGGTLVLVGVAAPELAFGGMLLQRQERTITGSHMYTHEDFAAALGLLADGLLPDDDASLALLFDRRPLAEGAQALADLVDRRSVSLKILLIP
ncbi:zinc-binding dehydrogenase [Microbacterium fluvii]|uniref:Zinc-binding dehydrogenase n=2 Tax=Microbacterium fluvii TaxID=415215 RepID=A0ABW2HI19_9MICO